MIGNPIIEIPAQNLDVAGVTVLGYDECQTVLTDPERFSSSIYEHIMGPVMGRTLLEQEGDEHRASRALVSPLFRAKLLERWRTELVEVVVHELIDRFAPRRRADLVREFTFAFPVQVIARLMGLPREDYVRFQQLSIELECGVRLGHRDGRVGDVEGVFRGDSRGAAGRSAGRLDQHAGGVGDRRGAAERRGDLRVPAVDPAGWRRRTAVGAADQHGGAGGEARL
jgi:hypothetical protein